MKAFEKLHLCDPILVGHSLGGTLALMAALRMQHVQSDISGLVLIDAATHAQSLPKIVNFFKSAFFSQLLLSLLPKNLLTYFAMREVFSDTSKIPTSIVSEYSRILSIPGTTKFLNSLSLLLGDQASNWNNMKYSDLSVPTLILWGQDDKLVPISNARMLNNEIANSLFIALPDCGHAPQEECPEQTAAVLNDFFSKIAK